MAGREGGGSVVGEPHSNSEGLRSLTYGRPANNGIGPTIVITSTIIRMQTYNFCTKHETLVYNFSVIVFHIVRRMLVFQGHNDHICVQTAGRKLD